VNRKADFLQNESIRIDSNRELECSTLQSLCAIFFPQEWQKPLYQSNVDIARGGATQCVKTKLNAGA